MAFEASFMTGLKTTYPIDLNQQNSRTLYLLLYQSNMVQHRAVFFLIYINDISNIFSNLKTILFVDNYTLYISGENHTNLIRLANTDLQIFPKWCLINRLTANLNKTYYMLFTSQPPSVLPSFFFSKDVITRTIKHTLLGITFDDGMTFKHNVAHLILKLSILVSLLYQVKESMPTNVPKMVNDAHVLPHLHYCTPIWCKAYPTHMLPLIGLQKKS